SDAARWPCLRATDRHPEGRPICGARRSAGRRVRRLSARENVIMFGKPGQIPSKRDALPGRDERMPVPDRHFVNGHRLEPPYPDGLARAVFGMGCFWGAEKKFWQLPGVYSTAAGYAAGLTPNPT